MQRDKFKRLQVSVSSEVLERLRLVSAKSGQTMGFLASEAIRRALFPRPGVRGYLENALEDAGLAPIASAAAPPSPEASTPEALQSLFDECFPLNPPVARPQRTLGAEVVPWPDPNDPVIPLDDHFETTWQGLTPIMPDHPSFELLPLAQEWRILFHNSRNIVVECDPVIALCQRFHEQVKARAEEVEKQMAASASP